MTRKRPGVLKVGDRVRFDGSMQTVVGLAGTLVRLAGYDGQASAVLLAHLLASEGFEIVGDPDQRRPPVSGAALAGLREDVANDALRWKWHIVEVLTGADPDAQQGAEPRPQYDPAVYSLAQREEAKAAELAAAGEQVTARTVKRKRQRYETQGLAGLVDRRAGRPGEIMEIDSTPLDVMVMLDNGLPSRVELTGMVDLATRTVTAAVLRPTTKSVDASLLLARTVTPEPMQPGWAEALSMARSVLPYQRLLTLDQRLQHATARPVMVPETIVCDHGMAFISQNFRSSCRMLGITFQPAPPRTPTDKPHIERTLGSVASLFAQFVSGYLGRSVEYRGRRADKESLWSLMELQGLLDEWIVSLAKQAP